MKRALSEYDIPLTPYFDAKAKISSEAVVAQLGLPVVVKDRRSSGGRNIVFAKNVDEVACARKGGRILEHFIDAAECSVESFVHQRKVVFANITEYRVKRHVNIVPAAFSPGEIARILDLNQRVISALKLKWGMTHVELYRHSDGLLFGEIGLRPPGGYIMHAMANAYRFDPWEALVAVELGEPFDFDSTPIAQVATLIFHPGAGTVRTIRGRDEARTLPGVTAMKIKIEPGDHIDSRSGVGQDVGYALIDAASHRQLDERLETFNAAFGIELEQPRAAQSALS